MITRNNVSVPRLLAEIVGGFYCCSTVLNPGSIKITRTSALFDIQTQGGNAPIVLKIPPSR